MNRLIIFIAAIIMSTLVFGAPTKPKTRFVILNPSQMNNNDSIPAGGLSKATIECGTSPGAYTIAHDVTDPTKLVPGVEWEELFADMPLPDGDYYCSATITASSGLGGGTSGYTEEIGPLLLRGGVINAYVPGAAGFSTR